MRINNLKIQKGEVRTGLLKKRPICKAPANNLHFVHLNVTHIIIYVLIYIKSYL